MVAESTEPAVDPGVEGWGELVMTISSANRLSAGEANLHSTTPIPYLPEAFGSRRNDSLHTDKNTRFGVSVLLRKRGRHVATTPHPIITRAADRIAAKGSRDLYFRAY